MRNFHQFFFHLLLCSNMGNTTGNNLRHKKKKEIITTKDDENRSTTSASDDVLINHDQEWIRELPFEILCQILEFADLHPRTIISLQTLSSYWRDVFKSNDIWRLMCRQYGTHSAYFKEDTDYFALFLSRYSVTFISEKSSKHYITQYKGDITFPTLQTVKMSNIPGQPSVLVARIEASMYFDRDMLNDSFENYVRCFKNQRAHPNLAVQNIFKEDRDSLSILSEPSDDYLTEYLISNPQMVTESSVCDVIKQILSAVDWLAERKVYSYYLFLENFRVYNLPDNKVQIKFYSAQFDFSGRSPNYGTIDQVPPEVLLGDPCTDRSYAWMIVILSSGWITFMLLEGFDPFEKDTMPRTFEMILSATYSFEEDSKTSPLAHDFISKLLVKEQSARMSLKDALKHEWIQSPNKSHEPMQHVVEGLQKKYKKTDY